MTVTALGLLVLSLGACVTSTTMIGSASPLRIPGEEGLRLIAVSDVVSDMPMDEKIGNGHQGLLNLVNDTYYASKISEAHSLILTALEEELHEAGYRIDERSRALFSAAADSSKEIELQVGGSATEPITEQELVGQWAATEIEGAIDASGNPLAINGSVSTLTFNANGTYRWFLHAQPFFNLDGSGAYSLNGNTLTVTGIIANTLFFETPGNDDAIPLTFGNDTFSFRDEDGARWRYAKVQ